MGRDLCEQHPAARALFEEADEIAGYALSEICFEGPAERLNQTAVTQPAVYLHSAAAHRLLTAEGVTAVCAAGHSLGEYSALHAAGVVDFRQGLELVLERGRLMQDAGEREAGTMAAVIGLDDDEVSILCAQVDGGESVVAANFNAPGQVVISGEAVAVEELTEKARAAGAKRVLELPVSGAFHSRLMAPAAAEMASLLNAADLRAPQIPIVTNVSAQPVSDVAELKKHLIAQITSPVRWTDSIRSICQAGIERAVEVGPGSVLKGLVRRIAPELSVATAATVDDIAAVVEMFRSETQRKV